MTNKVKQIVAADVSKDSLVAYWTEIGSAKKFSNDKGGIEKFVQQIAKIPPVLVVVECTGGYEHKLCEALWEKQIPLTKVNPGRVRHFCKAKGYLAKTDPIDAKAIYEFGMAMELQPQAAPSKELKALKQLFLRRQQLKRIIVMEKNHHQAPCTDSHSKRSVNRHVEFLTKEVKSIDKQIAEALRIVPEMKSRVKALEQQKSVGPVLLAALMTLLPELGTLNRGALASLVGVAPFNHDSGGSEGKRSIRGGRSDLRTVLYMATLTSIRTNGTIREYYSGLVKRGKKKMMAIVACMRKFLIHLNSIARMALLTDRASAWVGA